MGTYQRSAPEWEGPEAQQSAPVPGAGKEQEPDVVKEQESALVPGAGKEQEPDVVKEQETEGPSERVTERQLVPHQCSTPTCTRH